MHIIKCSTISTIHVTSWPLSSIQYLVAYPLALITLLILRGMESDKVLRYAMSMSFFHTPFTAFCTAGTVMLLFPTIFSLRTFHAFSMGFRSGLLPGHLMVSIPCLSRNLWTTLAVWHGAESCIKCVHPWSLKYGRSSCFKTSIYLRAFIVTLFSRILRPPRPAAPENAPHTIVDPGYFTVFTVYLGWNLNFEGLLTKPRRWETHFIVVSSLNWTLPHCSGVQSLYLRKMTEYFENLQYMTYQNYEKLSKDLSSLN